MELREVVRRRRMVRAYQADRPVPRDALTRLLRHAIRSPSAGFSQGWDFVVLTAEQDRARFWATATPAPSGPGGADLQNGADLQDGANAQDGVNPADHGDGANGAARRAGPDSWLRGLMTAPALVICLSDPQRYLDRYAEPDKGWTDRDPSRWPVPYWDVDTGMAAMAMLLTAVDEGLGACFFGVPPQRQAAVLEAFGVPPDRRVVGVIAAGLPATDRRSPSLRRGRRPLAEVVHEGRFGVPFTPVPPDPGR